LIDFAIVRKIPLVLLNAVTLEDLALDHSPELYNIFRQAEIKERPRHLTTSATN